LDLFLPNSGIHQHWVGLLPEGAGAAGKRVVIGIAARKPLTLNSAPGAVGRAGGAGRSFAG